MAIGLSLVGRSVTEISTASKTEQSSRAFSAAEAGLERALQQSLSIPFSATVPTIVPTPNLTNQAQVSNIDQSFGLPRTNQALEYPAFGKESFAQFWLADPISLASTYSSRSFMLYFGDDSLDYTSTVDKQENQPALEVHVLLQDTTGGYYGKKYYFDSSRNGRNLTNGFDTCLEYSATVTSTTEGSNRLFYCRVLVPPGASYKNNSADIPILARVRLLYTNNVHPVALQPSGSNLPPQVRIFTSTGTAGTTQRTLNIFNQKSVMPFFFDYVLFSAGTLSK